MRTLLRILAVLLAAAVGLGGVGQAFGQSTKKPSAKKPSGKKPTKKKPKTEEDAADEEDTSTADNKKKKESKDRTKAAEPSWTDPFAGLNVRPQRLNEAAANEIEDLYVEAAKELQRLQELEKQGDLKSVKQLNDLGKIYFNLMLVEVYGRRLQQIGEPAGADYAARSIALAGERNNLASRLTPKPGIGEAISAATRGVLTTKTNAAKKDLPRIRKLMEDDKLEEADAACRKHLSGLDPIGCFLDSRSIPYSDLRLLHTNIDEKIRVQIRVENLPEVKEKQTETAVDFASLLDQLKTAAAEIASSGRATVGGESLAGPAVARQAGEAWKKYQVAALRYQAWDWARVGLEDRDLNVNQFPDAHENFNQQMRGALAALIDADAGRATAEEAAQLHGEYLAALAPLQALSIDDSLVTAVNPVLAKLAAKSPALNTEVTSYHVATGELLRWRQRTARAYAERRKAEYPVAEDHLWAAARTDNLPLSPRTPNELLTGVNLSKSCPEVLANLRKPFEKAKVTVTTALGRRTPAEYRETWPSGAMFARFHAGMEFTGQIEQLSVDLLLSAGQAPLSLEAAAAIEAASLSDFEAVGGTVTNLGFQAVVPRLTRLNDDDWGLVRLAFPGKAAQRSPLSQRVYVRLDLQPTWVQNRYFFAEIPAGAL